MTDDDPLMLALMGEPVPESRRQDERFLAEYRAAVADVALLGEQVRELGGALGRGRISGAQDQGSPAPAASAAVPGAAGAPAPAPAPVPGSTSGPVSGSMSGPVSGSASGPEPVLAPAPVPVPASAVVAAVLSGGAARARRRPRTSPPARGRGRGRARMALGALAVVCAGALVAGLGWLLAAAGGQHGQAASDAAGGAGSAPGADRGEVGSAAPRQPGPGAQDSGPQGSGERYVACARLIAEGTVDTVERLPGGSRYRITLRVERYYRPAQGAPEATFVWSTAAVPAPRPGQHVLVGIPRGAQSPDLWSTGADVPHDRAWILAALPEAGDEGCR